MQLNPYLNFNGQCEAAFKFYEQCLGGKIIHAKLEAGENVLMGSDVSSQPWLSESRIN